MTIKVPERSESASCGLSRWLNTVLRWLVGLLFIVSAPNHYLQFVQDPPMPVAALALHRALTASGYVFQIVVFVEFVAGVLLILDVAVPFALILLAPVIVNIFCFHLFLAPAGLPVAIALAIVEVALAWEYRAAFAALFRGRQAKSELSQASM